MLVPLFPVTEPEEHYELVLLVVCEEHKTLMTYDVLKTLCSERVNRQTDRQTDRSKFLGNVM
jgi:hypothetical protein